MWNKLTVIASVAFLSFVSVVSLVEAAPFKFVCGRYKGELATISINSVGKQFAFIVYSANFFKASGYNNQRRCTEVSSRFQKIYGNTGEGLKYFIPGDSKGLPVVCASKVRGTGVVDCPSDRVLFTLESKGRYEEAIEILQEAREGNTAFIPFRTSNPVIEREDRVKIISVDVMLLANNLPRVDCPQNFITGYCD